MASSLAAVSMELEQTEGGQKEGAMIVELSPNPFSKAAVAAQRMKNIKRALQQANHFIEEAKEACTVDDNAKERDNDEEGGNITTATGNR